MKALDESRFADLLDAYGGEPARWPAPEREAALQLLARSETARAAQRQAAWLDAELDRSVVAPPSAALRAALIAARPQARAGWRASLAELWRELGGWRLAAPAFAASLALGAVAPAWLVNGAADVPDEDLIAAMQIVDELPEWTP